MVPYLWPDNRGRRSGIDRRKFSYAMVIPERRSRIVEQGLTAEVYSKSG
jgi:hypothetical protein